MNTEQLKQGISRANYMDFHGIRYIRLDELLDIIDKTLPQFTESERLAILWYKENKLEFVERIYISLTIMVVKRRYNVLLITQNFGIFHVVRRSKVNQASRKSIPNT